MGKAICHAKAKAFFVCKASKNEFKMFVNSLNFFSSSI